jgi:hypothetical protein
MTEDSHNLSWEDDDEPMVSLSTKFAAYDKGRNRRTIYSIATALSRGIARSTGRYHTVRRQIVRFYLLLRSEALPEARRSVSFCTRLSATRRIIATSPQYASIARLGRGVSFWRVALYEYGLIGRSHQNLITELR